jgi:hypothetical protein
MVLIHDVIIAIHFLHHAIILGIVVLVVIVVVVDGVRVAFLHGSHQSVTNPFATVPRLAPFRRAVPARVRIIDQAQLV